ncbi:helix-turn-helix domain-containing protein [Microbacterium sp. T32]|uniref:helix-turn-helix domain-containing protein n=1 Tax=Microbacterium sp. T32 TaxID=1776083 RepID=UPI0007ABDE68|nr:AraC family transcriptional regulator [Microbacterium sp. T32]KZE40490.1 hypothetical protein AVW09_15000 [Microbacterium sp. T32]
MTQTLRAEGPAVHEWFGQRGLRSARVTDGPMILIVDEIDLSPLIVRRLWHTPLLLTPSAATAAGEGATLALQAEGPAHLVFGDGRIVDTDAGAALGYPHSRWVSSSSEAPTARIEIVSRHLPLADPTLLPGADDGPVWRALASTVNAILNSDPPVTPRTRAPLQRAIESLCVALIADRPDGSRRAEAPRSAHATYDTALALIDENAASPDFTVDELARQLRVSRQYLARVFARRGSTPRNALRARRLDLADALLATGVTLSDAVDGSGFASARALSRARRERDGQLIEF